MILSKYHKHLEKYIVSFGNKDIFDFLIFINLNKSRLFLGIIFTIIIGFIVIYINIKNTPYITAIKVEPYFVNSIYPTDIKRNLIYYNQSINREEFLNKVFKELNHYDIKKIKFEIVVNEFNQNSILKFFLPQEINKDESNKIIQSFLAEVKNENETIAKNLNLFLNNPFNSNKNQLEFQENLIHISIKMKIIIDKLIKKYKIDLSAQNYSNSAYIYSSLDHSTVFTSIIGILINSNKINFKEIEPDIKSFAILKNDFDILSNNNYALGVKLRDSILPIFNPNNFEYLTINEKKKLLQENLKIFISILVLGLLISLIVCFFIDFHRNYKIRYKGNN
ncbi:hypothetical protein QEJ31_04315 [Pigmentibacter sp. JX0631]|uniref:hypothetical protein n=1 Tax=Pigmentibacter sp. JX0631 TaxID=2976982 RepID=UPI002468704F|nr:hypothetical protein [Pigmentibacter sp. JX0631]WGL60820.1 hypothetical protein QEJ31_04315 [Pigmentibacter sp. JX0631]